LGFDFATVLVFTLAAAGFVVVTLFVARLVLRPRSTGGGGKLRIYECGEPTVGDAWIRFDIRFYTVALMFVVFDVEVALLFPWGVVFRDLTDAGLGWFAFAEATTFIVILLAGLAYVWARGDIDWAPRPGVVSASSDDSDRPGRAGRVVARHRTAAVPPGPAEGAPHAS
jgi:NADH-quinone oxidoreductase subunit A